MSGSQALPEAAGRELKDTDIVSGEQSEVVHSDSGE